MKSVRTMSDYLMQLLSHVSTGTESQRGHKQSAFSRRVGVALACALLLLAACGAGAQSATPMSVIASATSLSDGTFEPEQMAVDSSGNVYGESSDTVYKESYANGVYTKSTVVPSTNDAILGLTVDNAGNLYILDASTEMVYKEAPTQNGYTQTVVYSQTAQTSGNAANPYIATANLINSPEGLAQDASGNLYVSDGSGTIYKGTLSGGVYTWNSLVTVSNSTSIATGIAIDSNQNIFVCGQSSGTGTVVWELKYTGSGYTQSTIPSAQIVYQIAVDRADNLYFAAANANAIYKETLANGSYTQSTIFSSGLYNPMGVAVDSNGSLYIGDTENYRLLKVPAVEDFGTVDVGTTTTQTVTFTFTAGGTIQAPKVLTQGATGLDFTDKGTGTCNTNGTSNSYAIGDSCTVVVSFKPQYPGLRAGAVQLLNSAGTAVVATAYLKGTGSGPQVSFTPAIINTVAGTNTGGYSGDGGLATSAKLYVPTGTAVDGAGNLYIADTFNNRIRKVDAVTSIISTVAGNGTQGYSGDGGAATSAKLSQPSGVAVDGAGNLYIADWSNSRIRKVDAVTYIISTVAGNGTQGYSGDGGAAISAEDVNPSGIAVDSAGNLYIADTGNSRIRRVDAVTSIISTVAGGGTSGLGDGGAATLAELNHPSGVTLDSHGNLYIADSSNYRIRRVDAATGIISTVAGNGTQYQIGDPSGDGGAAPQAELGQPYSVALDSAGNLYIADYNTKLIRKVDATTQYITTVAGGGTASLGDGGVATLAELSHPSGVSLDSAGNLWISDQDDFLIRKVTFATPPAFGFATTKAGLGSASSDSPQTATVQNIGNATLSFPVPSSGNNPSIATNFTLNSSASTACPLVSSSAQAAGTLNAGASCTLAVSFEPTAGGSISGSLNLTDDNLNAASATQSLALTGKGVGLSSIAVTPASPGIVVGGTQQFTATGTYSDNSTLDLSTLASWSSSNTTAATITSGLTTGNGVATGLAIGNSNITATLDNVTSNSATLAVSPNVAYAISVYDPYGNSATQSAYVGTFFNSLVVQVTNNAGVGVIGASVTFTSNGTGANAYLWNNTPSTATTFTVTTDANGYATVSYPTANTTVGSYTVSAAVSGVSTTASFNLTNLVMPIYTVTTLVDDASGNYNNCTDQSLSGATPDAACSLRDAIYAANHFAQNNETAVTPVTPALMPTINFASSYTATQNASGAALTLSATTPGTYTLGSGGTLPIYANMNIVGPGAKLLTVDGNNRYLDFFVYSGATVYLSNVAVQGGSDSNQVYANQGFYGQGIDNAGTLSLSGISMSNYANSCVIDSTGILVVDNSIFDSNSSNTISVIQSRSVNHTAISLHVTNSIFSNNTSGDNGTGAGVIGLQDGIAQISSSTFYGNHTAASGAAIGIAETGHNVMTITNSTFYNNSAGGNGGAIFGGNTLTVINSTFSGNTAANGGNDIDNSNNGTVNLANDLLADGAVNGPYTDNGGNLIAGVTTVNNTTVTASGLNLAPLANYGGATQTMIPLPGSAAICAGTASNALSANLNTDQRGVGFSNASTTTGAGGYCPAGSIDAGAVQTDYALSAAAPAAVSPATSIYAGAAFTDAVTLNESGSAFTSASATIPALTLTGTGTLSGSTATATSGGIATFSGLKVSAAGTGDTLTAALPLNSNLTPAPTLSVTSASFAVLSPMALTTTSLAQGTVAVAYSQSLQATGGSGSYSYTTTSTLPAGITLSASGLLAGTPTRSGSYSLTIVVTDSNNTSLTASQSYTLQINAPSLSLPATTLTNGIYGTAYSSAITAASGGIGSYTYALASGSSLPPGLTLNSSTGAITGTPTAANATAYAFTIVATDTGSTDSNSNHYTASQSYSLTVNPAALTITANNASKNYGTTLTFAGIEFKTTGLLNSDAVTSVTLNSTGTVATATVAGGPYSIIPTAAVGTGLANYTVSYANGSLTVNPAALTITANSASKNYGTTLTFAGTEFKTTGLLNSDAVTSVTLNSSGATSTATVAGGPYSIIPTAAVGTGLANYTVSYANGSLSVSPAALTITANNATKSYGTLLTFAGSEFKTTGLLNSDAVTSVTLNSTGTLATATVAGGPYSIIPTAAVGTGLANYTVSYANGSLTVNGSPLNVTANNAIMVYGSALPTLSGSLAGVLNNDNIVVSYSTTATSTSPVSASGYPIIASLTGAALSNYTLTNTPGTLTITQDTPTLLLSASSTAATPGQAVTFTAKVTSTTSGVPDGTVVFYDSGTAIGSAILVNGTASLSTSALLPGINNTITASYGGCTSFSKVSSSSLLAINVSPLDFTISITGPNYATVVPGSSVTYQVTVTPLYVSYAGTVSFAVTGLPSGYAVTFSPSSISTNSGAQTISVTITTPSATAKAQPASTLGRRAVPFILALLLLPLAGASRIRQQGRRMSRWMFLLLVLCGMTAASALSGCGGGFFQKPVHNYTVTITATGGGLEHSIPVTLQVQ